MSQARALYDQRLRQLDDLTVKSPMAGRVQLVSVEVGAQVGPGTNLVRISDPTRLKAEVRISETQTRDLSIGQIAKIDTRSGIVKGHVTRIDPASTGGTVGVDVTLDEPLPTGARPDQSVDGVDRTAAPREHSLRRESGVRPGEQHDPAVQGPAQPRGRANDGEDRRPVGAVRRSPGRPAGRRPRGAVRHVAIRLVRSSTTELTAGRVGAGDEDAGARERRGYWPASEAR